MSLSFYQQRYVDVVIHNPKVKKEISSPLEYQFKKILSAIGQEGKDWFHQSAFYNEEEGLVAVPDFVFKKEKLIIELDDKRHKEIKIKKRDIERDKVFRCNGFSVVRIPVPISKEKEVYWKVYIQELLKICLEEQKKQKSKKKKRKLFTNKEFDERMKAEMLKI